MGIVLDRSLNTVANLSSCSSIRRSLVAFLRRMLPYLNVRINIATTTTTTTSRIYLSSRSSRSSPLLFHGVFFEDNTNSIIGHGVSSRGKVTRQTKKMKHTIHILGKPRRNRNRRTTTSHGGVLSLSSTTPGGNYRLETNTKRSQQDRTNRN